MKKLKVMSAEENKYDEQLSEILDKIDDNIGFVIGAIETLGRRGSYSDAIQLAQDLNDSLDEYINQAGSLISE